METLAFLMILALLMISCVTLARVNNIEKKQAQRERNILNYLARKQQVRESQLRTKQASVSTPRVDSNPREKRRDG